MVKNKEENGIPTRTMPLALRLESYTAAGGTVIVEADKPTIIPPGATAEFSGRPQVPFRPSAFFFADDKALKHFNVLTIRVGRNAQDAASGAIPAAVLHGQSLRMDIAQIGMTVSVTVQNVGWKPRQLWIGVIGEGL